MIVFTGEAELNASVTAESQAAYLEKYRDSLRRIDMTPESLMASYSLPLRVRPKKLRGF